MTSISSVALENQQLLSPTWRLTPGYIEDSGSDVESVHILLGRFLTDRDSADPLPEKELFSEDGQFEWGYAQPLEKTIASESDLNFLAQCPNLFRNAISIIEPWEHVGMNDLGEEVRASKNVAFMAQKIADCDSILFPVWSTGTFDLNKVVPIISSSMAVVLEGGKPSVHDSAQWTKPNCSRDNMFALVEKLLLSRSPRSAPAIFICVSHQLAAECHIRLLRQAVKAVLDTEILKRDEGGEALASLKAACEKIKSVGENLKIEKRDGRIVAQGWHDDNFAVVLNEEKEVGDRVLLPYKTPKQNDSSIPIELLDTHEVMADELEGVIDNAILRYENDINIAMFHSDEVNEEAILFANWAYMTLHNAIVPHRYTVAASPLSWLLQMPYAVEILASTEANGEILTECSCTCINYKDFETKKIRRSFTCQFHPELLSDLRDIGKRSAPSYAELKQSDGMRLLARLLYEGMQE
ncbi:hypothetical protein [Pleurocapsa sp. PCC 7319]|uniref:hypothetical protein n=1 Tax=Pleurocapsa sp. PCC 7319 TaxID=118161 RepID=UPI00034C7071|nr:hypothetical protein [Pleurocapsa sp. PCC 7319]